MRNLNPLPFVSPAAGRFVDMSNPINWQHPLNQGRVGWWKCVANPGWRGSNTLHDLVRGGGHNPNDGTLSGATIPKWQGNGGLFGSSGALSFNGSTAFVATNNIPGPTFSALISVKTSSATSYFLGNDVQNTSGFLLGYSGGSYIAQISHAGGLNNLVAGTVSTNWCRVCLSVNGTTASIYANGKLVTSATITAMVAGSSGIGIGKVGILGNLLNGLADDVTIWNRALSAQDAALDYALSRQGYPGVLNYLTPQVSTTIPAATRSLFRQSNLDGIGSGGPFFANPLGG